MNKNYALSIAFHLVLVIGIQSCADPKPADYTLYLSIEDWTHKFLPDETQQYPIKVTNQMKWDFSGNVNLSILERKDTLRKESVVCEIAKNMADTVWVEVLMPEEEGTYEVVAWLVAPDGHSVKSRRIIEVDKPIVLPEQN